MGKKKTLLFSKVLWIVLTAVFAALFTALMIGNYFADYYAASINSLFKTKTYKIVDDGDETSAEDKIYYTPKFVNADGTPDKESTFAYDKEVALKTANEGAVLLWNNNGALPLKKDKTLNLFGARSASEYRFVVHGSGGTKMHKYPNLKDSFKSRGFTVNETLYDFYDRNDSNAGQAFINETPWSRLDQGTINTFGGTAVYIIGRNGGEGSDMSMTGSDGGNGNVTALSDAEISILDGLVACKNSNVFDKIVVLLNAPSMSIQFDVLSTYGDKIDACMWVGLGGTSATDSVADLLSGAAVPSGHLVDTFLYNNFSAPATENLGDFDYTNVADWKDSYLYQQQNGGDSTEKNLKYMVYQEGIYVGYKYYETRYEDSVLGNGNASSTAGVKHGSGSWKYADEVAYPFGYGLSYTTFKHSDFKVREDGDSYIVNVTVENTGDVYSGKDVVQVYLQKPYTKYAEANGIEQAAVGLVGFAKTDTLAPHAKETVEIVVDKEDFKTYDANNVGSYIIDEGDYYLAAGEDAHSAVNNILAAKGKPGDRPGNSSFTHKIKLAGQYEISKSVYTGEDIVNRFDDADINKNAQYGNGKITYLSRKNWQTTYPSKVNMSVNQALYDDLLYNKTWEDDIFDDVPTYDAPFQYNIFALWKDKEGNELPYDFELWNDLLDQTSFEEQTNLICNAWCATQELPSVGAPGTMNCDGPAGMNYAPAAPVIGLGMCYPCEPLMAATFNTELLYEIGVCLGEDVFVSGYTILYGPGANIHRTPFSGRNGEYYSEDSYLSSVLLEAEVKGLQSNGTMAQIKHFALNDSEINRNGVAVWANEQSVREIYLEALEGGLCKGRGESLSVMSSFNRIGALWAGAHKGLLTDVLRGEWGFEGFVQSDGNGYKLMSNYVDGLRAGNDIFMCGGGKHALDAYKNSTTITLAMREATHRVLYALTRTHAMNGLSSDTRIEPVTPWWRVVLTVIDVVIGVLTVAAAAMLTVSVVRKIKANKSENDDPKEE